MAFDLTPIHLQDVAAVPGLFGIRPTGGGKPYTPAPQRWGPMCDLCWLRDRAERPLSSALCPHGGGG